MGTGGSTAIASQILALGRVAIFSKTEALRPSKLWQ